MLIPRAGLPFGWHLKIIPELCFLTFETITYLKTVTMCKLGFLVLKSACHLHYAVGITACFAHSSSYLYKCARTFKIGGILLSQFINDAAKLGTAQAVYFQTGLAWYGVACISSKQQVGANSRILAKISVCKLLFPFKTTKTQLFFTKEMKKKGIKQTTN